MGELWHRGEGREPLIKMWESLSTLLYMLINPWKLKCGKIFLQRLEVLVPSGYEHTLVNYHSVVFTHLTSLKNLKTQQCMQPYRIAAQRKERFYNFFWVPNYTWTDSNFSAPLDKLSHNCAVRERHSKRESALYRIRPMMHVDQNEKWFSKSQAKNFLSQLCSQ